MVTVSTPTEVTRFRDAYGELWKHYLAGRGVADLATLGKAPFDYWQLVYQVDDLRALVSGLHATITTNPARTIPVLYALEDLFGLGDLGLDVTPRDTFFPGNFFTKIIAPHVGDGNMMKATLGYVRLNMLLVTLHSLAAHNANQHVTAYCHDVANSPVYRRVMQLVGELVGPVRVTV